MGEIIKIVLADLERKNREIIKVSSQNGYDVISIKGHEIIPIRADYAYPMDTLSELAQNTLALVSDQGDVCYYFVSNEKPSPKELSAEEL